MSEKANLKERETLGMKFRRNFVTGLIALAPVWLTIYLIVIVVRLVGGILSPYFRWLALQIFPGGEWVRIMNIAADVAAFIFTIVAIALFGTIVRRVVGRRIVDILNLTLGRIPVIRQIYESIKKFLEVFFGDKSKFKRVVAIRFPTQNCWSIAFVTNEVKIGSLESPEVSHLTLYVPTTPVPTSGFLVLAQEKDVVPLSISVDAAVKLLVSGGTLIPEQLKS